MTPQRTIDSKTTHVIASSNFSSFIMSLMVGSLSVASQGMHHQYAFEAVFLSATS
jgi:hypothetical protein